MYNQIKQALIISQPTKCSILKYNTWPSLSPLNIKLNFTSKRYNTIYSQYHSHKDTNKTKISKLNIFLTNCTKLLLDRYRLKFFFSKIAALTLQEILPLKLLFGKYFKTHKFWQSWFSVSCDISFETSQGALFKDIYF